ncbi:hypothetical protein SAPIO_CDS1475 [Scedosporium apiospermum]|uniref:Uncharacterized protein n=1 Tax=Pseudallescheria apiosperma TaxID=563466 RepID=A0A084GED8_PSEDA|nr:uncharacterized protein SAPIO_CDS1475 [Scedosporium apiospermum]KEZ45700.1 hypothetical protein SAPIO_CDS1475 [Scedosporium apiospermum]
MHLLDLPPELVYMVVHASILARSFKRAMRLRLVSHAPTKGTFRDLVDDAIVNFRMLHDVTEPHDFRWEFHPRHQAWRAYAQRYLAECIIRRPSRHPPLYEESRLRYVVDRVAKLTGEVDAPAKRRLIHSLMGMWCFFGQRHTSPDYIRDRLSRLYSECRFSKESSPAASFDETDLHCLTLEAAIYLGRIELVRQLLAVDDLSACMRRIGHASRRPELAYYPARRRLELAAYSGSVEILKLLLSADLGVLETELDSEGRMKGHMPAVSANLASKQGHHHFFNYILDISEPFPGLRRHLGLVHTAQSEHYREAMRSTAFPEDLERMTAIFRRALLEPGPPINQSPVFFGNQWHQLAYSASLGRAEVVRYLLEQGVRIDAEAVVSLRGVSNCRSPIICTITKSGSVELLRLLLDHGADPNGSIPENAPLLAAIRWGTPAMVQVLIEYGADVNKTIPPAIIAALFVESEEIFRLLRGAGAVLDNSPQIGGRAMSLCHHELVVSKLSSHSAKVVCESSSSWGPDFISIVDGYYCDMCEHALWKLCLNRFDLDCWDMHKMELRMTRRTIASRSEAGSLSKKVHKRIEYWD